MSTTPTPSSDPIWGNLDTLLPDLEALYKDVHSHPELSMQETIAGRFTLNLARHLDAGIPARRRNDRTSSPEFN